MLKDKLSMLAQHRRNVLMTGPAGVGKTSLVKAVFEELYGEGNYLILSGSTLDAYADVVGIPYAGKDENGNDTLIYLRPHLFAPNIRAIAVDEFNRAPKAARNAFMELSQFKSVNGIRTNIEILWGMVNPEDEVDQFGSRIYDVEPIDPAQRDRFHCWLTIPSGPDKVYFTERYTEAHADAVLEYWSTLDVKKRREHGLTPRRLDYALEGLQDGLDINDFIPQALDPHNLANAIAGLSVQGTWRRAVANKDKAALEKMANGSQSEVLSSTLAPEELIVFFDYLEPERILPNVLNNDTFSRIELSKKTADTLRSLFPDNASNDWDEEQTTRFKRFQTLNLGAFPVSYTTLMQARELGLNSPACDIPNIVDEKSAYAAMMSMRIAVESDMNPNDNFKKMWEILTHIDANFPIVFTKHGVSEETKKATVAFSENATIVIGIMVLTVQHFTEDEMSKKVTAWFGPEALNSDLWKVCTQKN